MFRNELINKILKKAVFRYKNISVARSWSYLAYTIRQYKLNYEEYNYIYKVFNKYIQKNKKEQKEIEINFTINGKIC